MNKRGFFKDFYYWDYTFLYAHIHYSLKKMETFIIGKRSHSVRSPKHIRRYKEALELSRRIAFNDFSEGSPLFQSPFKSCFSDDNFMWHRAFVKIHGKNFGMPIGDLQEMAAVDRLMTILRKDSRRYWD